MNSSIIMTVDGYDEALSSSQENLACFRTSLLSLSLQYSIVENNKR
jgi:hypothetical protein